MEPVMQSGEGTMAAARPPRILLVDDNKAVRTILRKYLGTDYEILEADNGQAALDIATQHYPDLVISDLTMPVMDGIEFVRRLRAFVNGSAAVLSRIPVVMLTSLQAYDECISAGANDFVAKPVTSIALRQIIDKYLTT